MTGYTKQAIASAPTWSLVANITQRYSADVIFGIAVAIPAVAVFIRLG